jgi:hypothetical protein
VTSRDKRPVFSGLPRVFRAIEHGNRETKSADNYSHVEATPSGFETQCSIVVFSVVSTDVNPEPVHTT